ncbi:hypothetical protein AVEN_62813-1 [Araneus ventricosus]|uniref:Uncharacterized protein n=1 Tax=Araneus ventricosus TaxID=182803 RepID=A0A4Y2IDU3_ARAVE|nr:hypothetical protein AVEN_62813-1 [Araneus ventricosus]
MFGGTDLDFQHDSPSIHASKSMSQWLSSIMGSDLSGLAPNPDSNFMKNVWGKFTNLVYQNSKQYSSVEVLKLATEDVWFELFFTATTNTELSVIDGKLCISRKKMNNNQV